MQQFCYLLALQANLSKQRKTAQQHEMGDRFQCTSKM